MKRLLQLFLLPISFCGYSQLDAVDVDPFANVMIHPYFEVELRKGTTEKVEVLSSTVDLNKINVEVSGKTLHLYLDEAKVVFKKVITDGLDPYDDRTKVKAVITYRDFQKLTVYGEERLTVSDDLDQRRLQLRIYGETHARFESMNIGHLKVGLYGDNKLTIKGGDVPNQVYTSYGDNEVHARNLRGSYLKFTNFGDNELYVGEQEYVKVTAFGDATLSFIGDPVLDKKIALGDMTFVSRH